jgi:hypothetical protein
MQCIQTSISFCFPFISKRVTWLNFKASFRNFLVFSSRFQQYDPFNADCSTRVSGPAKKSYSASLRLPVCLSLLSCFWKKLLVGVNNEEITGKSHGTPEIQELLWCNSPIAQRYTSAFRIHEHNRHGGRWPGELEGRGTRSISFWGFQTRNLLVHPTFGTHWYPSCWNKVLILSHTPLSKHSWWKF